jgi:hypothetical protein
LQKAAGKGRAVLAFFQADVLKSDEEGGDERLAELLTLARDGVLLYVSNREAAQDFEHLSSLAEACRTGGTRLVYYHHGEIVPEFQELVRFPLWLHLNDRSLHQEAGAEAVLGWLTSSTSQVDLVLSIEKEPDYLLLKDILAAGAYVLFRNAQFDYRSPLKELERAAAKRRPPFTAFYLYPHVTL